MVSKRRQNNRSSGWIEMIHSPAIMPLWGGAPSWTQVALVNLYLYFGYPTLITSGLDMSPGFRVPSFRWLNSPLLDRSSCAGVRLNKPLRVSWHAASATKLLIRRGRILLPVTLKRGWILWPGMLFPFHPHVLLEQLCPKLVFLGWGIHRRILRAGTAGGEDVATSGLRMRLWPSTMGKSFAFSIIFLAFT